MAESLIFWQEFIVLKKRPDDFKKRLDVFPKTFKRFPSNA